MSVIFLAKAFLIGAGALFVLVLWAIAFFGYAALISGAPEIDDEDAPGLILMPALAAFCTAALLFALHLLFGIS